MWLSSQPPSQNDFPLKPSDDIYECFDDYMMMMMRDHSVNNQNYDSHRKLKLKSKVRVSNSFAGLVSTF